MPHHFFTHGVPNTPQMKPTEDNRESYFKQHVSNVTLCRCQIYSAHVQRYQGSTVKMVLAYTSFTLNEANSYVALLPATGARTFLMLTQ
jgi:hypothetical protein